MTKFVLTENFIESLWYNLSKVTEKLITISKKSITRFFLNLTSLFIIIMKFTYTENLFAKKKKKLSTYISIREVWEFL